jgi:hypothetical protein
MNQSASGLTLIAGPSPGLRNQNSLGDTFLRNLNKDVSIDRRLTETIGRGDLEQPINFGLKNTGEGVQKMNTSGLRGPLD